VERLNWMYEGVPDPSTTAEDYLLGKAVEVDSKQEDVNQVCMNLYLHIDVCLMCLFVCVCVCVCVCVLAFQYHICVVHWVGFVNFHTYINAID